MIKAIGFDLGYTLVRLDREERMKQFLEEELRITVKMDKIEKAYHLADKDFMRQYPHVLGRMANEYMSWYFGVVMYYMGLIGVNLDQCYEKYQKFAKENQTRMWKAYPGVKKTLTYLKKKGYQLALISNWDLSCRKILDENRLLHYFDSIVVSSEVKLEKPQPQIFHHALNDLQVSPQEFLYIGDNYYDDVLGSRPLKIKSMIVNPYLKEGIEEIQDVKIIASVEQLMQIL